ncbi:MAG TPA: heavy-metal-associated domain-containing protein, partial [Chloroflexota bacterium]|nr:heavy-metal-associated domain-containing protein [Chloroflexota bacterium]
MTTAVLTVPEISCDHCARTITEALTPVEGVRRVSVDVQDELGHGFGSFPPGRRSGGGGRLDRGDGVLLLREHDLHPLDADLR